MSALTDAVTALLAAARAGVPPRQCALCGTVLAPGYAAPILDPAAREGPPDDNWQCLDGRGCDQRAAARARRDAAGLARPGLGWLLARMAGAVRPEPLALPPPRRHPPG